MKRGGIRHVKHFEKSELCNGREGRKQKQLPKRLRKRTLCNFHRFVLNTTKQEDKTMLSILKGLEFSFENVGVEANDCLHDCNGGTTAYITNLW